jgi:GH43 family beta-xylosidase
MRKHKSKNIAMVLMVLLNFILLSSGSCKQSQPLSPQHPENDTLRTYTNPLGNITNIGDPYILKYDNKYYMYATSSPDGFKVWESDNLIDWQVKGLALDKNNSGNNWGTNSFWAPEVKFIDGKFYMSYSARIPNDRMKIRIAVSDNPLGPFINWSEPFLLSDDFSYIDSDLFLDGDKVFMYFTKDCSFNMIDGKHTSQIYVAEMSKDLKSYSTQPILATTPSQNWENQNGEWRWNEGSFVMKHDQTYYLMYSANVFNSADYSVGYATASNPLGPWTKYAGNPILKKNLSIHASGPGHNSVTSSPDGKELFIVYHTHTFDDKPSGNRNLCIDRMIFEDGVIKVQGPTRSPQPLPGGVKYRIISK